MMIAHEARFDSCGHFFLGTSKGIVTAPVDSLLYSRRFSFPIIVNQILSDHWFTEEEVSRAIYDGCIRTSVSSADISLHFTPLIYGRTGNLRFRYRLEGHEDTWHLANHDHRVFYENLWPGRYTLIIEAIGAPEISGHISLLVLPTWPLIFSCIGILAFLLFLWRAIRFSHKRIRYNDLLRRKHELELAIVANQVAADCDLHHQQQQIEASAIERQQRLYKKSPISENEAHQLLRRLRMYMEEERPWHRQDLRLSELAIALGTNATRLSQVLNQYQKQNFFDYVNDYRLEAFKRRARDKRFANLTFVALAEQCGFKRSSFFAVFKKREGCTPTEWLEKIERDK